MDEITRSFPPLAAVSVTVAAVAEAAVVAAATA